MQDASSSSSRSRARERAESAAVLLASGRYSPRQVHDIFIDTVASHLFSSSSGNADLANGYNLTSLANEYKKTGAPDAYTSRPTRYPCVGCHHIEWRLWFLVRVMVQSRRWQ